jgi:hypothetical protein
MQMMSRKCNGGKEKGRPRGARREGERKRRREKSYSVANPLVGVS